MRCHLRTFIEALITENGKVAGCCLSPSFTMHDGLTKEGFISHEIEEFRRRLFDDEREPEIQVIQLTETEHEICVVARGLIYATNFTVDDEGLICSNGHAVECVPKLRHNKGRIDRAAAIRAKNSIIQSITPKFPVTDYHLTTSPALGVFSYLYFSNEFDPAQSFDGDLRVMMKNAGSVNVGIHFPGLEKFADWQEKELFPIIGNKMVKIPSGKSRPWNVAAWLDDGSHVSIDRPQLDWEWTLDRPVKKAMITDALDNDWVTEMEQ